jgi:RHS repeat-associated protein
MSDGEGSTSYVYNSLRQLESETRTFTGLSNKSYKLNYTYNLADQLKKINYRVEQITPFSVLYDKTINYAYNSVGALGSVGGDFIGGDPNNSTNVLNTVTFRASGALSGLNYGNGRRLAMGYNANRQQPISMKVDRASNPSDKIIDYAYQYYDASGNNNNRIRQITDNVDPAYTTTYLYDDYNRLTNATAGAYTRFYYHDRWGNITNFSGVTHNYATNASGAPATNRIISDGWGNNYSYDLAGNMTQAGSATYGYDGASRLKSVNGTSSTYGYDGNGGRVRVTDGGAPVYYVRSSVMGQVAMEVNSSGVRRAYLYAGGKLVAQQSTDGQFYWLHTNHLGSSRAMTDVNGTLVYKGQFDPYGQALLEWSSSGNTNLNSRKFGYERDAATGLDYANARMYTSLRGRFMQPDPSGLGASELNRPQSLNTYVYTRNDPVNFVDPSGLGEFPLTYEECNSRAVSVWTWGWLMWGGCLFSIGGGGVSRDDQQRDQRAGGGDIRSKDEKRRDALNLAKKALERTGCSDYIASDAWANPLALLNTLDDRGQFQESPEDADYFKRNPGVPAFTEGVGVDAKIKLRPAIDERNPTYFVQGFYDSRNLGLGVPNLDPDTQRALAFLHELSHATGKFNDDPNANHPGQLIDGFELTRNIYEKCFR